MPAPMSSRSLKNNLCRVLLNAENVADAEPLLRELPASRIKAAPVRRQAVRFKSLLGGALFGKKKFAEAEPLVTQGYEGVVTPKETQERLKISSERLPSVASSCARVSTHKAPIGASASKHGNRRIGSNLSHQQLSPLENDGPNYT
jgi:hypothetical protein